MTPPEECDDTLAITQLLSSIDDVQKREDLQQIMRWMAKASACEPKVWQKTIIGYGEYHYKYASGREGDWFRCGVAPRRHGLSVYLMSGFEADSDLLTELGKHKIGKACLTFKNLQAINPAILQQLIERSLSRRICSEA